MQYKLLTSLSSKTIGFSIHYYVNCSQSHTHSLTNNKIYLLPWRLCPRAHLHEKQNHLLIDDNASTWQKVQNYCFSVPYHKIVFLGNTSLLFFFPRAAGCLSISHTNKAAVEGGNVAVGSRLFFQFHVLQIHPILINNQNHHNKKKSQYYFCLGDCCTLERQPLSRQNKPQLGGSEVKASLPAMRETWVRSLGQEDPLEKEMATHSSILAWRIPWMEEPGGLQPMGSQRVEHN